MFNIDPDITKAETLPKSFYNDKDRFKEYTDSLFSASWQWIGDLELIGTKNNLIPFRVIDGIIEEPLLIIKDSNNKLSCVSNVCTHRGNILVDKPKKASQVICGYHGRRFGLEGEFLSMPEFDSAKDFPRSCENLTKINLETWSQFIFVNLTPKFDFSLLTQSLDERIGFMNVADFNKNDNLGKKYLVGAHWALYCDNYLEGFHIPYVHPELNQTVEYQTYETILFDYCNLQIANAKEGTEAFDLPSDHIDYGKRIAAYYYWVFPNMMLNFYPWGLSVNIVRPIAHNKTEVEFISYVRDPLKIADSAGASLNNVELEDEEVVESVQQGIKSRFYSTGRFSPTRETGVHHFHGLIAKILSTTS
jgi:choline monooxygenase